MGVVHVGLVHRDPCHCKVKGFRAVSSIERNVSKRRHLQGVRQKEQMEVALLVSDDAGMGCVGIGVIDECSLRGVWCGFLVPNSFFVVVIVTKVSTECQGQNAYCEEESMTTLGAAINRRV